MIIVNLKGGLGNQMFQYAFARHLAKRNNDVLKLDTSSLEKALLVGDSYRPFSLNLFNIKNDLATPAEIAQIKKPEGLWSKLIRRMENRLLQVDQTNIFNEAYLNQTGDIYLDGHWQSPLFFNEITNILLSEFALKSPLSNYASDQLLEIKAQNSVAIHVRRGDYVGNSLVKRQFGLCSVDYYKKAVAKIRAEIELPKFFVFSDDIDWVKQNLSMRSDTVFVSDPTLLDAEELYLMSQCQHNIIANSSFSWWGAWLNQNPAKIVIAPTPWFDRISFDQHLIPEAWIQLPK